MSLYLIVRVLRPCGWNVTSGESSDAIGCPDVQETPLLKSTSLLKSTGARLPPMRSSFCKRDEAIQRQDADVTVAVRIGEDERTSAA